MTEFEFEWDDGKARSNLDRHGVSFNSATAAFRDPFAIEFEDRRMNYGEQRFILIGMVDLRLILVVFAMRDDCIRLISARGAEPFERKLYHEQKDRF